jgi:quinol monooxygenase YgiN
LSTIGIFIEHRTLPGKRDAVFAIWKRHMAPAIAENPGHLDYFYGLADQDPDTLLVFQRYRDHAAAAAFLQHPSYSAYQAEVERLLQGPPTVRSASIAWTKADH